MTYDGAALAANRPMVARPKRAVRLDSVGWFVVFLVGHAALGVLVSEVRFAATAYAAGTILAATAIAFTTRQVGRIAAVAAYLAVSDVLWRMTKASVPWEGGKYFAIFALLIGYFRFVDRPRRVAVPVAFLAMFVPAALLSVDILGLGAARDQVSTNVAGPALLCVSVVFFRQVIATEIEMTRIFMVMLGPISAICAIASWSTFASGPIEFGSESSFLATGGFGPNQVSVSLALGGLICVLSCLRRTRPAFLIAYAGLAVWFVAQAFLTFSRGGLYSLAAGVAAIVVCALATSGMRSRMLMGVLIAVVVAAVAFPSLDAFTDGSLGARFTDTNTAHRTEIANADVELFARSPLFGVGIGVAKQERDSAESGVSGAKAHTEYSRMLGEQGMFGLLAIGLMIAMAVSALMHARTRWNRLIAAAFIAFPLLTFAHNATGVAATAFVFGLSQLRLGVGSDERQVNHMVSR